LRTTILSTVELRQRFGEARKILHEAQAQNLDNWDIRFDLYYLAFVSSDSPAMAEQLQWFAGNPYYEYVVLTRFTKT